MAQAPTQRFRPCSGHDAINTLLEELDKKNPKTADEADEIVRRVDVLCRLEGDTAMDGAPEAVGEWLAADTAHQVDPAGDIAGESYFTDQNGSGQNFEADFDETGTAQGDMKEVDLAGDSTRDSVSTDENDFEKFEEDPAEDTGYTNEGDIEEASSDTDMKTTEGQNVSPPAILVRCPQQRTRTGSKPGRQRRKNNPLHVCMTCGKACSRSASLRRHEQLHDPTTFRPVCPYCGQDCSRQDAFVLHIKRWHPNV